MKNIFRITGIILLILIVYSCKKDKPLSPTVVTTDVTEVTYASAKSGGEVTDDGGAPIISRGVCWNTSVNPTILNNKTTESGGLGTFTSYITQLNGYATYHVRAYATNSAGTGYGNQIGFTTTGSNLPIGKIKGIVQDASTSDPLSNVILNIFWATFHIVTGSTQNDGRYEIIVIPHIGTGFTVVFSKQDYLNAEYQNVIVPILGNTILEPVFLINESYSGSGNIRGTIKSALDGTGIPNVLLQMRSGINVTSGNIISSTTTSSLGIYTFTDILAGNYTIEATNSNFDTTYVSVICLGGLTKDNQDVTMSPNITK